MNHPSTLPEILDSLDGNRRLAAEVFARVPEALLIAGDPEHWSPAHHLAHLTATSKAVARGLRSDSLPLHPTGSSRTYAEVRDAATQSLADTPRETLLEMGRTVVIGRTVARADIVDAFESASRELRKAASTWSEAEFNRRAMTHPLAGPMTVREMLLFMVVHERHHLKIVRRRIEAESGDSQAVAG